MLLLLIAFRNKLFFNFNNISNMKKKSSTEQHPKSNSIKEITLSEFLKMEVPKNVENIYKDTKIPVGGPFTSKHQILKKQYGIWFEELVPIFRKLDLMLHSNEMEKGEVIPKNITISELLSADYTEDILPIKKQIENPDQESYIKTKISQNELLRRSEDGNENQGYVWVMYSECHLEWRDEYKMWIPELEDVFEKLESLEQSKRPIS